METHEILWNLEENIGKLLKINGLIGAVNGLTQAVAIPKSVQKHVKKLAKSYDLPDQNRAA